MTRNDEQQQEQQQLSEINNLQQTKTDVSGIGHQEKGSGHRMTSGGAAKPQLVGEGEDYWKSRYERLKMDYDHLQAINQKLEDKLLNIVDEMERRKDELVANVEYEKSTLMADVNKLSTKLVDARIKLHDYEEKELLHAAECGSPCHKGGNNPVAVAKGGNPQPTMIAAAAGVPQAKTSDQLQMLNDPNLV